MTLCIMLAGDGSGKINNYTDWLVPLSLSESTDLMRDPPPPNEA